MTNTYRKIYIYINTLLEVYEKFIFTPYLKFIFKHTFKHILIYRVWLYALINKRKNKNIYKKNKKQQQNKKTSHGQKL